MILLQMALSQSNLHVSIVLKYDKNSGKAPQSNKSKLSLQLISSKEEATPQWKVRWRSKFKSSWHQRRRI